MPEEIEILVNKLYQESFEKPFQVYEVFKDYFDEERVDIQGIPDSIKRSLQLYTYNTYFSKSYVLSSDRYKEYDSITQNIIKTLIDEGALKISILSDYTVFKYLFPFLCDTYGRMLDDIFILVHFPEVRVTNENDKFVDIKDLYAKVKVSSRGTIQGTFYLARTDYPTSHLTANYMHSHIPSPNVPYFNFQSPCLGRGPINNTILSLVNECNLDLWMLFCHELNIYVRTESLGGGPYVKLETISKRELFKQNMEFRNIKPEGPSEYFNYHSKSIILKPFIRYIIENEIIKFIYSNGNYNLAMSYLDYNISISNAFIEFINNKIPRTNEVITCVDNFYSSQILKKCIISNGIIYNKSQSGRESRNYLQYNGKPVFKFKGQTLNMNIYEDSYLEESENEITLLNSALCESILFYIMLYLNTTNGTENTNSETRSYKKYFII